MLRPKRTKFNKVHKGLSLERRKNALETKCVDLRFGNFGLKATIPGRITAQQIEAARRVMLRKMNLGASRAGRLWVRVFPDVPVTAKPIEVRMGKGKGGVDYWATPVKAGRILFEFDGVDFEVAKTMAHSGAAKLPISTKFIAL